MIDRKNKFGKREKVRLREYKHNHTKHPDLIPFLDTKIC